VAKASRSMSGKRGPLLPAGNAHINLPTSVSLWNSLGSLWVQKAVFLVHKRGKKLQKTVIFEQKMAKKRCFGAKMGVKRVKNGCNNRVFGGILGVFGG